MASHKVSDCAPISQAHEPIDTDYPIVSASDRHPERLVTQGIRINRDKVFDIKFTGAELYDFLALLEDLAVKAESYSVVRDAVLFCEKIREIAHHQGF